MGDDARCHVERDCTVQLRLFLEFGVSWFFVYKNGSRLHRLMYVLDLRFLENLPYSDVFVRHRPNGSQLLI